MAESKPLVPVILGPTASGKTSIGIELAKLVNGEVVSIDSRKVYKGIPVGTATPPGKWRDGAYWVTDVAHHLMDFLPLDTPYTAGDFVRDAERCLRDIVSRGKTPVMVGGTGFYFKALANGLPALPAADLPFRKALEARIEDEGIAPIYDELTRIDPKSAERITSKDRHKIIRALEVFHLTQTPMSEFESQRKPLSDFQFAVMGLEVAKDRLDQRIEQRSAEMVKQGMLEETAAALRAGYAPTCPALTSFGYKEATQVALGTLKKSDFLPLLIKGTKAYAKRQRTWFRTQTKPIWFSCEELSTSAEIALKMKAFCYTSAHLWNK